MFRAMFCIRPEQDLITVTIFSDNQIQYIYYKITIGYTHTHCVGTLWSQVTESIPKDGEREFITVYAILAK